MPACRSDLRQAPVGRLLLRHQFIRREKDAAHFALDEMLAQFLGVLQAGVGVLTRMRRAAPEQTVFMDTRETGQFAANELEDFRVAQIRE